MLQKLYSVCINSGLALSFVLVRGNKIIFYNDSIGINHILCRRLFYRSEYRLIFLEQLLINKMNSRRTLLKLFLKIAN